MQKTKELKRQKRISKSHGTILKGVLCAQWKDQKEKKEKKKSNKYFTVIASK